ncbi:MAG: glycosyltransferase family 2 protein [Candidatus Bathyarchaeota archaeon]|nr:glycosyltransferase family 2 protein [Candidatus Bathyarchaeota archaeon]MDH5745741.1 glycosyltransferase family 2 protein [Candidatus Bathyarchaeota archaeon]
MNRAALHKSLRKEEPLVSIIVLNFNGRSVLCECLKSVFKTNYSNFEVIVVDNGSTDGSCAMINKGFLNVQVIKNQENFGYSKGNNIGILGSKGEFIVLLNNDTIVHPSWLSKLLIGAKLNPECFYQPKILFAESKIINSAGNLIQLFGFAFPRGIGEPDTGQYDKKCEISYASGACVLASKRLIKKIGLLDEGFFTFYEDVNWGWRALMLGHKSIYVPSAVIYHRWGSSWGNIMSSKKFFFVERSRLATVFRNYSLCTLVNAFPLLLFIELLVLLYSLMNGFASEKIRSYSDILKNRKIILGQRIELQKKRKIPDSIVLKSFSHELDHPYLGRFAKVASRLLRFLSRIAKPLVK